MLRIKFVTKSYRPNALITLRTSPDWKDLPALYEDDAWTFELELSEAQRREGLEFKFVLDRRHWMLGDNLSLPGQDDEPRYDESTVRFPEGPHLITEQPAVARRLLGGVPDEDTDWDVIVVGSGMGGGVLADQLSDSGKKKVLVLEAGGYLFPTHVANLPRRQIFGEFDKHVWRLWREFRVPEAKPWPDYRGGQSFNLGGRSVFWGGLIPRASDWELAGWPESVREYLFGGGYEAAEELVNAVPLPDAELSKQVARRLEDILPTYQHRPASLAVQYPNSALLSAGMFSTADLLVESLLTGGPAGNENLTVALNTLAVRVQTDDSRVTQVVARDLIANTERRYRGKTVVLAAGTIGSARLARASGLTVPSGRIGVGITDHPIFYTHFLLPKGSPFATHRDSAKLLSRHEQSSADAHAYIALLEVGADLNQGRYVDDDLLRRRQQDPVLGEVVFLLNARLRDDNRLLDVPDNPLEPVTLRMNRVQVGQETINELEDYKTEVLRELGATHVPGQPPDLRLQPGDLGGVAHEVGTMRMGTGKEGVVDEDLKVVDYENLYVCDLSMFPSSPAANPSLTLVALAQRLATRLADQ